MSSFDNLILFICFGVISLVLSILAVLSKNLLRSVTYLFLVLVCTAGFYLLLNYHFLAFVQISVYAGGIIVLLVFSIFLTNRKDDVLLLRSQTKKYIIKVLTVLSGLFVMILLLWKNQLVYNTSRIINNNMEIDMKIIGNTLIGTGKYQYLLPFEVVSLLLLACVIGGILIARQGKKSKK